LASLGQITLIQTAICVVIVLGAPTIVQVSGLFYQQIGVLRLGAVGALFQFVFFAATSLLLFFDQHGRFLALQAIFLALQGTFAMATMEMGAAYYGFGYLAACVISAALAFSALESTMENLTFITFCRTRGRPAAPWRGFRRLLPCKFPITKLE
jgi:uncharacterized membrane protein